MREKRAFTRVDVLVVVVIIALLLSILMPSLSRVRKQGKAVECQARLGQWGVIFSMYMDDNEDCFPCWWWHEMRAYYTDPQMRCCPTATKVWRTLDCTWGPGFHDRVFSAWGIFTSACMPEGFYEDGDYGSYGMNEWVTNYWHWPTPAGHANDEECNYYWSQVSFVRDGNNISKNCLSSIENTFLKTFPSILYQALKKSRSNLSVHKAAKHYT